MAIEAIEETYSSLERESHARFWLLMVSLVRTHIRLLNAWKACAAQASVS